MYYLLVVCLSLSALLTINAFASLGAAALWRAVERKASHWPARTRAQIIFALRVFPLAGALIGVGALILPSYLAYEPRPPDEVVTAKLAALTVISAIGIGLAVWRGFASWRATRRLSANWLRQAETVQLEGTPAPACRIRHSFPVIAVVGVFRPRLFLASQVFDSLSRDEITAAIRHEAGHLAMRDNLKRVLMRACRDALIIAPCGRLLDDAWSEATEAAADEHAARAGAAVALDLASALIKIARLVPEGERPVVPAGAFLMDEAADGVVWRVRRLTHLAETGDCDDPAGGTAAMLALLRAGSCAFVGSVACTAASPAVLEKLHVVMEQVFRLLR